MFYLTDVCRECGNLKSVCADPTVPWYPQRSYCYASAAREQIWRRTRKAFKQPDSTQAEPHTTDGLAWWMSQHDLTPEDDFFGEQALAGRAQQADGQQDQPANGGQERGGAE